jgi:hypothetical protein
MVVGLVIPKKFPPLPATSFDISINQPTIPPLLLVDNDSFSNSVAALASVEEKEAYPSASCIDQAVRLGEDASLADDRLAPSGALKVNEAMMYSDV